MNQAGVSITFMVTQSTKDLIFGRAIPGFHVPYPNILGTVYVPLFHFEGLLQVMQKLNICL